MKSPKQKSKMEKPKLLEKPRIVARDARAILTEHYKSLAADRRQNDQQEQSPLDYATGHFEDKAGQGVRTTAGTVKRGIDNLQGRFREHRSEGQQDTSRPGGKTRTARPPGSNSSAQPSQAGRPLLYSEHPQAVPKEKRAMQIWRLQQYRLKQGSIRRVKERPGQAQEAFALPSDGQSPVMQPEQAKKRLQLDRAADRRQAQYEIRQAAAKGEEQRQLSGLQTTKRPKALSSQSGRKQAPSRTPSRIQSTEQAKNNLLRAATAGGKARKAGVKTASATQKQATKKAKQAARRQAMKRAARLAKATGKTAMKAARLIAQIAAALVKSVVALLSACGPLVVIIVFIAAVAALIASPFGIFFSDEDKSANVTPILRVVHKVNEECNQRIEDIKSDNTWDTLDVQYVGTGGSRGNIWIDILAVFAVKTALADEGMDVATIDQTRVDLIREVFWDMTEIDHWIEIVAHTDSDGGTWYERILHIIITQRTAWEQAEIYGFNNEQNELLEELLSGSYDQYFMALITGLRHLGDGTEVIAEGFYIWPSAASDYVTSFFGTRLHPILGVYKTHSGIDIGAGYGTAILAAADGVVTTAAYDAGGYGNYLIIDHGNGNMTLYAHMSQMSAGVGQTVKQGQTIGFVGSTGLSTGPHLHFEVYVGGTRVDPLLYFSNYTAAW